MESNTNQSEEKQSKPKAKRQPKKKAENRVFVRRLYIPDYGMVDAGDAVTAEAEKAWKAKTEVPIDSYVGEKAMTELPLSDKEKLAEYEAMKKK